jgi:hypothetical protein
VRGIATFFFTGVGRGVGSAAAVSLLGTSPICTRVQEEVVEATRPPDSRPMAATFGEPRFTSLRLTSKSTDL